VVAESCRKGQAESQFNLGVIYGRGEEDVEKNLKEAVKWYRKAAEQDHVEAQNILEVAQKLRFEEAKVLAENGNAEEQYCLGALYANGEGVPEDDKEGVKWLRIAAEQGHETAQFNLGVVYANGEGVLEDDVTAYAWYNIAAANGHAPAKKNKDSIAKAITPEQITKAQELSKEMVGKNPKLLKK